MSKDTGAQDPSRRSHRAAPRHGHGMPPAQASGSHLSGHATAPPPRHFTDTDCPLHRGSARLCVSLCAECPRGTGTPVVGDSPF